MLKQPSIAGIFPLKNPLLKPKQDEIKKPKIKEQKVVKASKAAFCMLMGYDIDSFTRHDNSKAAKEYNAWKTWVYKHGDKPWPHLQLPDNKADIANLMMLDALLDPSIKGMVDASKPSAGVGHALYNLYSMRHWRMMNPGIARDQQVEVSAADASDIASKALKAIKPLLEKAVLKNLLPYVCEGYLFGYEHCCLGSVGATLDSTSVFDYDDLKTRLPGVVSDRASIIEPFNRVQDKKLRDANGNRPTIANILHLIQIGAAEVHLLDVHCGPKAKVTARLAECACVREAKKMLPGRVMNVRDGASTVGKSSCGRVGVCLTMFDEEMLHAAGYTWQP